MDPILAAIIRIITTTGTECLLRIDSTTAPSSCVNQRRPPMHDGIGPAQRLERPRSTAAKRCSMFHQLSGLASASTGCCTCDPPRRAVQVFQPQDFYILGPVPHSRLPPLLFTRTPIAAGTPASHVEPFQLSRPEGQAASPWAQLHYRAADHPGNSTKIMQTETRCFPTALCLTGDCRHMS